MKPEEIHAHVARIHDDMARAMGHRPDDQQHRAWIEHDWLRGLEPGSGEWDRALRYLGLADLPLGDPAVPEALRGLLAPPVGDNTEGRAAAVGVGAGALAGLAIGAAQGGLGGALMGTMLGAIAGAMSGLAAGATIGSLTDSEGRAVARDHAARLAALDALEAAPFVIVLGELLVENLPAQARAATWGRELVEAREAAEARLDRAEELRREISATLDRLGQPGADPTLDALSRAIREDRAELDRIDALAPRVAAAHAEQEVRLTALRDQARLVRLRGEAHALTGAGGDSAPMRLGAAWEVSRELQELEGEMGALRAREAEARLRATAEVARATAPRR